jgi:hypothetical protein
MLITRIQPGIYMSAWMLVWAVVSGKLGFSALMFSSVHDNSHCHDRVHGLGSELWRSCGL